MSSELGGSPHHALVMRIAVGKTNGNRTLYGRVFRHKQVEQCPFGALGLYLLSRFHCADEEIDFSSNQSWFDVKLLIEAGSKSPTVPIKDSSYRSTILKVFKENGILILPGIPSKHFVHFGRNIGAIVAELRNASPDEIKLLGNWNPDTQEDRYSAKLPTKILKIMAGFYSGDREPYFILRYKVLTRSTIKPPDELVAKIFPFAAQCYANVQNVTDKPTLKAFLKLLLNMRSIIIQDVAMMLLQGRKHLLFDSIPVFHDPLFIEYQQRLAFAVNNHQNPVDTAIDVVLPGLRNQLANNQSQLLEAVEQNRQQVHQTQTLVEANHLLQQDQFHEFSYNMNLFARNLATNLTSTFQSIGNFSSQVGDQLSSFTLPIIDQQQLVVEAGSQSVSGIPPIDQPRTQTPSVYRLYRNHQSFRSIWHEWHGTGQFAVATNTTINFTGGIDGLERNNKGWRKQFSQAEQQLFSRTKYLVMYAKGKLHEDESNLTTVLSQMDALFQEKGKSISSLSNLLKKQS